MIAGPDPKCRYPFEGSGVPVDHKRTIFLKNAVTRPNIIAGDYSYYDDPAGADDFENRNVLYHYWFSKEKLIIGKFCAIAASVWYQIFNTKLFGISKHPFIAALCSSKHFFA